MGCGNDRRLPGFNRRALVFNPRERIYFIGVRVCGVEISGRLCGFSGTLRDWSSIAPRCNVVLIGDWSRDIRGDKTIDATDVVVLRLCVITIALKQKA